MRRAGLALVLAFALGGCNLHADHHDHHHHVVHHVVHHYHH